MSVKNSKCNQQGASARSGFTLLEMCVAMGIASLVLIVVAQVSSYSARSFVAMGNYADLDRFSRNALDNMTRDIRQAKVYAYYGNNAITFQNLNTNSWFGYYWNQNNKTLSKLTGAMPVSWSTVQGSNVVLTGCDYFDFRVWLRNPTNNFWFPYSANSQPNLTKLIDVSWRCKRRVLSQYNTESVQTAKIVLRN
jgi:prepilin-type N-terminal cleavage/methylation domain-containing protein